MTTIVQGEVARGERLLLREKRLGDAPNDYRWRTEPDLTRYDAARPLTMNYQEYLALARDELLYPNPHRRTLAIEDNAGRHIGNVMYYNIDRPRQEAELGITIGDRAYWGQGYGTEALRLFVEHLLGRMGFRRLHLKTLDWNGRAQRCFANARFAEYGRTHRSGNIFILMELRREWLDADDETADGMAKE